MVSLYAATETAALLLFLTYNNGRDIVNEELLRVLSRFVSSSFSMRLRSVHTSVIVNRAFMECSQEFCKRCLIVSGKSPGSAGL
jgi:hypothetical protein